MWWNIIKSSRDEAYSNFLEEFGPGVDLNSLELKEVGPDAPQLIGGDWTITLIVDELYIHSMKYEDREFVQGIFEEEYPERYKEIEELLYEKGGFFIDSSDLLPDFRNMSSSDRAKWLSEHDFCYRTNGNFVGLKVRNYLIGSLFSFYDGWSAEETTDILRNGTSYNFGEFTNIGELFYEYAAHLHDWNYRTSAGVRRMLNSTIGQFEVLEAILERRLIESPYYKEHFGR